MSGLADAVQGARHTVQQVTWFADEDGGVAQNLADATLTGKIRSVETGEVRDIDGELSPVSPAAGRFSWEYGAADVAEVGVFYVQFVATYAGNDSKTDKSVMERWEVLEALDV